MKVLGIETSCDETSAAIVEKQNGRKFGKVLSEVTVSQINKHKKFGGVVPELASREHSNNIDFIVKKTLKNSNINLSKIDAFAATTGPGLLGGLLVGTNYAKALAISCNKPFLSINHLARSCFSSKNEQSCRFSFYLFTCIWWTLSNSSC